MDNELNAIANSFLVDIVYTAMDKFNITFDELWSIFERMNFVDIINDTETMVVGAHHSLDIKKIDNLQQIKDNLAIKYNLELQQRELEAFGVY